LDWLGFNCGLWTVHRGLWRLWSGTGDCGLGQVTLQQHRLPLALISSGLPSIVQFVWAGGIPSLHMHIHIHIPIDAICLYMCVCVCSIRIRTFNGPSVSVSSTYAESRDAYRRWHLRKGKENRGGERGRAGF